jgi:uncharacterized protein DUF4255/IPT/TIG domain-containing protein
MSGKAIGAVSEIIKNHLTNYWQSFVLPTPTITIGRPEKSTGNQTPARLNLFLYELKIEPFLKNTSLGPSRSPPVWLVAKYVLTAFDSSSESDTVEALRYLGEGIRILAALNKIPVKNGSLPLPELDENPEDLMLTIEDVGVEVLSRIMQGPDQLYRSSAGFEVRPIMLAPSVLPTYSLLVGIDYTQDPFLEIGQKGIQIDVDTLLPRPSINAITPSKFELDTTILIHGKYLETPSLAAYLGTFELLITSQTKDIIECHIATQNIDENSIMAGSHIILLVQNTMSVRQRRSNLAICSLIPKVDSATPHSLIKVNDPRTGNLLIEGNIDVLGNLLGRETDDVVVGLYKNGRTTNVLTEIIANPTPPPSPPQHSIRLPIRSANRVEPDNYRLIYTVNGEQAKSSPLVRLDTP